MGAYRAVERGGGPHGGDRLRGVQPLTLAPMDQGGKDRLGVSQDKDRVVGAPDLRGPDSVRSLRRGRVGGRLGPRPSKRERAYQDRSARPASGVG